MAKGAAADRRTGALRALIEMTAPVEEAQAALAEQPAGRPGAPAATMMRADALRVLDRYLAGELTHVDCARWAGALRTRRDLAMEEGHDEMLRAFLFEIATPQLFRPLSNRFAERWRRRLAEPPRPAVGSA